MLERYRVLGAVLALDAFTVADLARFSGVKETTVRTVLDRDERFVERIGLVPSGRRGGQPWSYQLRPELREELRSELEKLEDVGYRLPRTDDAGKTEEPPHELVAAVDTLLRLIPMASPEEKSRLLARARRDYELGRASQDETGVPSVLQPEAQSYLRLTDFLLRLTDVEQALLAIYEAASRDQDRALDQDAGDLLPRILQLRADLRDLLGQLAGVNDNDLVPDLWDRISASLLYSALRSDSLGTPVSNKPLFTAALTQELPAAVAETSDHPPKGQPTGDQIAQQLDEQAQQVAGQGQDNSQGVPGWQAASLVESGRRYLEAITEVWVQSVDQAARAGQWTTSAAGQLVPTPSADYAVPTPKQLLDTSFELAQQVLNLQRQTAGALLGNVATITAAGSDPPAPEQTGQQPAESEPVRGEAAQQAQQGSETQAREGQGQEVDLRTAGGGAHRSSPSKAR